LEESRLGNKEKEELKNKLVKGDLRVIKDSTVRVWGAIPKLS